MARMSQGNTTYLLLHGHGEEFVGKGDKVSGVVAVPDGQEEEGADLGVHLVVQEAQALVHVVGGPSVRVDVERVNELERASSG